VAAYEEKNIKQKKNPKS